MSDFIAPNIIYFQTQNQLATLNNIQVLLKSVLNDLRARNFVLAPSSLCAQFVEPCSGMFSNFPIREKLQERELWLLPWLIATEPSNNCVLNMTGQMWQH